MEIRLKWWTIFCLSIIAIGCAWYFNIFNMLIENDITYLSWVILILYAIFTIRLGYKIHISNNNFETTIEWFTAETMLSIGMIGTVVGFIYMLSTVFLDINISEPSSLQNALGTMAAGMGTALWTTLTGLICSVSLKTQLILLTRDSS